MGIYVVAIALRPYAKAIEFGTMENLEEKLFQEALSAVDWSQFQNTKVVVKGCSKVDVPATYVYAVTKLKPLLQFNVWRGV